MPQSWYNIEGTIYGNPELSKKNRHIAYKQTKLLDAVDPATEFKLGKRSGDKVGFRLTGRLSGTASTALAETTKIPFATPPIYHGTGQVFRYGRAIPWTGTRKDLDRLDVEESNIRVLRDDIARTMNALVNTKLAANRSFTYVPLTSSTYAWLTNGTVSGTANAAYSLFHARKIKLNAKQVNMPPADGQNYFFYGSPIIEDDIFNDTGSNGFVDVSKYAPSGAEGALRGEIGKFSGLRHVIDNDVITDGIGTGSAFGSGYILGEEALKEILVYPAHFRVNTNVGDDFGNQSAIAWQMLLGHVTPWNYTTHGQGSIIHYTSA